MLPTLEPMDLFWRKPGVSKSRCCIAAFICHMKASEVGCFVGDCHFGNFGVQLSNERSNHNVVIIDAGARELETFRKKSAVTSLVMRKFWKQCDYASVKTPSLLYMWQRHHLVSDCLAEAMSLWDVLPRLTNDKVSTVAVMKISTSMSVDCDTPSDSNAPTWLDAEDKNKGKARMEAIWHRLCTTKPKDYESRI